MHSEAINEISAALAKAQGQIEGASKGKVNPAFKSKYADLASVWDACREALSANGLAVLQMPQETPEGLKLVTMLTHSSGQWFSSSYTVRAVKNDPQGIGSALTYFRRYALMAMVGIAPEDDDGEAAMGRNHQPANQPAPKPVQRAPEPEQQSPQLRLLIAGLVLADTEAKLAEYIKINTDKISALNDGEKHEFREEYKSSLAAAKAKAKEAA